MDLSYPATIRNLHETFENGLALAGPDARFLGQRTIVSREPLQWGNTFEWQSWGTVDARRRALGSGIYKLFQDGTVQGGDLRTVGIWSRNTASAFHSCLVCKGADGMHEDWQLIELSLQLYNLTSVALYDTLGQDAVGTSVASFRFSRLLLIFIFRICVSLLSIARLSSSVDRARLFRIGHADVSVVFASAQNAPRVLQLAPRTPALKIVVLMEEIAQDAKSVLVSWGETLNVAVMDLTEGMSFLLDLQAEYNIQHPCFIVEALGNANPSTPPPASSDTIATICYTSVSNISASRRTDP